MTAINRPHPGVKRVGASWQAKCGCGWESDLFDRATAKEVAVQHGIDECDTSVARRSVSTVSAGLPGLGKKR